ncbi:MAG TPA: 2-oxoacid:acceptor oxidoreductase family protein [Candidatus Wunengus sp. YC63]|uniref:2-oxoacid:acceptor oxidoreductase family protein n=1 Tax=Candidatus Wunengus sp. YC63 TaxID=3367699 RepID=UPI0040260B72
MLRLRFHGRGGQGAKVASRVFGTAAFYEGYYAQDFPLYGAERRGAPIAAFTRISKEPILERGVIAEPDIVIVLDETLLEDPLAHPSSGLKEGGIVFVNTTHSPAKAKLKYEVTAQVITLDITKIGLEMLGLPVLSTLAGGIASRIAGLGEDALRKAVEKEASEIITDRELVLKNIEASLYCFHALKPIEVKTTEVVHKGNPVVDVPFETALISSPAINATGNTPLRKTGNWRVFKPVWNYDICTKCMTCVARCPDGCIAVNEDGFPYTDYDNCKGCMICFEECPVKAIERVREVHAW